MTEPEQTAVIGKLLGRCVIDAYRRRIGRVCSVVVDDDFTAWVVVQGTRLSGGWVRALPAHEAFLRGEDVFVSYSKGHLKRGPALDPAGGWSPLERAQLHGHYRMLGRVRPELELTGEGVYILA